MWMMMIMKQTVDSSNSSSRRCGDQPESEKDSDVGGVWIVGNVEELEDEEASDALSEDGADQRDGFSRSRADQREGFSKIRADQDDGFSLNSRRKTCKRAESAGLRPQQCQEETGETKSTSPRNRFFALTTIEVTMTKN